MCIAGAAFIIGFYAGVGTFKPYCKQLERNLSTEPSEDMANVTMRALEKLREGDTNAIPYLDDVFDSSISELGHALDEIPKSKWDPAATIVLYNGKVYRTKYPWNSDVLGLDEGVGNAFLLLDQPATAR
jgi:hypothetical protein